MTPDASRQAARITRALRELAAGRLSTTPVEHPVTAGGGWQVTTTTRLARQLADAPNGHTLVRRRVAATLDVDPARVGVSIDPDRGVITLVLCATPQPHQPHGPEPQVIASSSQPTPAASDSMPIAANPAPGDMTAVATLDGLAVWWRHLDRPLSLAEARHANRVYETRRPVGYQIGHQANHPDPADPTSPARYTLDVLVPKSVYATIATFNTLADVLDMLADEAIPRARRRTASHAQIQQALAGVIARHVGTPTIFDIAAAA